MHKSQESAGVPVRASSSTRANPAPDTASAAAAADSRPVDPARVRLALAAACDAAHLAEQVGIIAADLYGRESAGEALVMQVLAERIATLANCACALLDLLHGDDSIQELEKLVLSSRSRLDGVAA